MKTHNFIISSTRPELLNRQITSFANIRNNRKLNFYIFNDSNDKNEEFLNEISKIKQTIHGIDIYYFDLNEQIRIIKQTASVYSSKVETDTESVINCFKENDKINGIRSIQNKSVLIFYLNNKDKGSIIHKIDDDIFPYEANRRNEIVEIILKQDFFDQKEVSIRNNSRIISGSNYTIDSPSPLVNYADFTEFLFNFYNIAKNKSKNEKIGENLLKISPTKVKKVLDPNNILDLLPINEDVTYEKANDGPPPKFLTPNLYN